MDNISLEKKHSVPSERIKILMDVVIYTYTLNTPILSNKKIILLK